MTTQYFAVPETNTVGQTIDALRELDEDYPTIHSVYVLDDYGKLVGLLSLRTLVLTDDKTLIKDVMFDEVISATPDETEEEVAAKIFKYDIPTMPVKDEHGKLLGIITVDDAYDVIEEDTSSSKTRRRAVWVVSIVAGSLLFLVLYTFALLQILGYSGR